MILADLHTVCTLFISEYKLWMWLDWCFQVWKNKKVWEGFIRCCQKMKPQSFTVLLQLRAPQLKSVFESCPDLKEPLLAHVNSFAPNQVHSSCFSSAYILFFHFRIIGYIRICSIKNDFCLITESPFAKDSACHSGESPWSIGCPSSGRGTPSSPHHHPSDARDPPTPCSDQC